MAYRGDWAGELRHGSGVGYWEGAGVKEWQGAWAHGVRHGKGVGFDRAGMREKEGKWKNGVLV